MIPIGKWHGAPMNPLRVSRNIVAIGELKVHTARVVKPVRDHGDAVVITQHGRAAAVMISPAEYDRLTARERVIVAIEEGLDDVSAGRVTDDAELDEWFGTLDA